MGKQDIIEIVENSLKRTMAQEAKFQAKHAPTGKEFKPNYKPAHYNAQSVYTSELVKDTSEIDNIIVAFMIASGSLTLIAFQYVASEFSVSLSHVMRLSIIHREEIVWERNND